jgi:thioredoxin:protein disulfide reductase
VIMILWGCFFLGVGIFLSVFLPDLIGKKILNRVLGFALCLAAFYVLLTGFDRSIAPLGIRSNTLSASVSPFTKVQDINDINRQLLAASERHQPVMLDFYADWCESCVTMDAAVFNTAEVKQALSSYLLLRVDITANSEQDQALLKHFKVIAPPTVLFFNAAGQEIYSRRMVGEINAKEFLTRLHSIEEQVALIK